MAISTKQRADLAMRVSQTCVLTGEFRLRSGQLATTYFDKHLFEADPMLLREVATQMADLVPPHTEVLAGLELGGIPVVTALSLITGLPAAFVRKEPKTYGTARLAEGASVADRRTLIVEDVITTGGQAVLSADQLRRHDADLVGVLCVIDRSGGSNDLVRSGLSLRSLFTSAELVGST